MSGMLDRHLVLIGFMGCGKSTVGPGVADRLDAPFVDVDQAIVELAGKSIPAIFAEEGEEGFRRRETEALRRILDAPPQVVAAGGGLITQPENRRLLSERASTVWLRAPLSVLLQRVAHCGNRPLLQGPDGAERAARLYREREPLYATADLHVDATLGPGEVADIVAAWVLRGRATKPADTEGAPESGV